jgi:hypothetical protein
MTTDLSFTSNTIPTFAYEPFSFTISNPNTLTYTTFAVSNSPGIPTSYFDVSRARVIFSTTSNLMVPGINQQFVITASGPTLITTSSNTVTVGTGRFRNSNGNSLSGSNLTFYRNEPITPIQFRAPFAISTPTTVPTLPPGLGFTDVSGGAWYNLAGTPTVTVPQTNYLVIGQGTGANLGKIVTSSNIAVTVGNERLLINVSGSPIISQMTVGTDISSRVITAAFPPYPSGGKLVYTWSGLPDGIVVKDFSGNTRSVPFEAYDPSYTLVLSGAPTVAAANAFRLAGIDSNTVNITATRTDPTPTLTSNIPFTFSFNPTVLFTANVVASSFYSNAPLDPSANYFSAVTAFGTSPITNIFSPDLRADLSINFVSAQGRGYLTGTPGAPTTANSYTIRAINAASLTRDFTQLITVAADAVTFTPRTDVCYNFIVTRPLSNALSGYYPASIQFQASATSGKALTFTTSDLTGTGLTLSNVSSNIVQLTGIPIVETALKNLRVTATAADTLATATQDVSFSILADTITFAPVTLSFIQNRAITPVQLSATARSQRSIVSYSTPSVPAGLSLSTTGLLSGTPTSDTSGSFPVTASTGFASDTTDLSYSIIPDSIIFPLTPTSYTYPAGGNVSIDITGIAYSGKTVSNYSMSNYVYDLSINSTSGILTGPLSTGLPPNPILPASSNFAVTASAGTLDGSLGVTLTTTNAPFQRFYAMQYVGSNLSTPTVWGGNFYYTDSSLGSFSLVPGLGTFPAFASDLAFKNTSTTGNTILICATGLTSAIGPRPYGDILRSVDGTFFGSSLFASGISNARPYKAIYDSNSSAWYVGGTVTGSNGVTALSLFRSTDDGVLFSNVSTGGIGVAPRNNDLTTLGGRYTNYYTAYGTAFGASNGVFLLGGTYDASLGPSGSRMKRSTDGTTWTDVSGIFEVEVGNISTDGPVWVATGSSLYQTGVPSTVSASAVTLKYSTDQGQTWSNATGFTHDVIGHEVAYASNVWLSSGIGTTFIPATRTVSTLVCSSDGINWSNVPLGSGLPSAANPRVSEFTSIFFDTYYSQWYVYFKSWTFGASLFSHPPTGDMTIGWTTVADPVLPFSGSNGLSFPSRIFGQRPLTNGPTTVTLSFDTASGTGPTITSPTNLSFTIYQYVTIDPIAVTATGDGQVYFFVVSSELPTGITFDPATGVFSGVSVDTGTRVVNLYAKDDTGIRVTGVVFNTVKAAVTRQQTSAGAWTSLVRQYTVVNSAQNSVNGRVLPEPPLGEFMRDEPPNSVTTSNCPKC